MSPKTGRPLKEKDRPLRNDVKVRLDDITLSLLDNYCKNHKITRAEAIRKAVHKMLYKKN